MTLSYFNMTAQGNFFGMHEKTFLLIVCRGERFMTNSCRAALLQKNRLLLVVHCIFD